MTEETEKKAKNLQSKAKQHLDTAYRHLREAQNQISTIEGSRFCDVYEKIADHYYEISKLEDKLSTLKPTGLSKI